MGDYPKMIVKPGHIEPVPRRVRAMLGDTMVLDTTRALYVWEWPNYPQYYIPVADVDPAVLVDEQHPQKLRFGTARRHGLRLGEVSRPGAARLYADDAASRAGRYRPVRLGRPGRLVRGGRGSLRPPAQPLHAGRRAAFHPQRVRIELDGAVLAESSSPVMVFETGLPTRYYLNRTEVNFARLLPTATVTSCPYKGKTSGYWSVRASARPLIPTWRGRMTFPPASSCPSPA